MKITAYSQLLIHTFILNKLALILLMYLISSVFLLPVLIDSIDNCLVFVLVLIIKYGVIFFVINEGVIVGRSEVIIKEVELFENYINIITSRKNIEKIPYSNFNKIEITVYEEDQILKGYFIRDHNRKLILLPELFGVKNGIEIVGKFKLEGQKL